MVEEDICIHIGYHKTASTFLQRRIFPNIGLRQIMLPMDEIAQKNDYDAEKLIHKLNSIYRIRAWDQKKMIISQESLSGHLDGNGCWEGITIAKNLKVTFPNAKILIVIRNQFDLILSVYSFKVLSKGIERNSLLTYLKNNSKLQPGLKNILQYDVLVKAYQRLFNKKDVLVLPYEHLKIDQYKFIKSVTDFIGKKTDLNFFSGPVNASSRNYYIIFISRIINYPYSSIMDFFINSGLLPAEQASPPKISQAYMLFRRKIFNPILTAVFSASSRLIKFPETFRKQLYPIYQDSNHRLSELIDIDLKQLGYPW